MPRFILLLKLLFSKFLARQSDRQPDSQTHRHTERLKGRKTEVQKYVKAERHKKIDSRERDRQTIAWDKDQGTLLKLKPVRVFIIVWIQSFYETLD
jgi:hypothetical protein